MNKTIKKFIDLGTKRIECSYCLTGEDSVLGTDSLMSRSTDIQPYF